MYRRIVEDCCQENGGPNNACYTTFSFGAWTNLEEHGLMDSVGILMDSMPSMPVQSSPLESITAQSIVIQRDHNPFPHETPLVNDYPMAAVRLSTVAVHGIQPYPLPTAGLDVHTTP